MISLWYSIPLTPGLLRERRVRLLEQPSHVDLLAAQREAAGIELREVENVTDQPLEPSSLRGDDLERLPTRVLVLRDALAKSLHMPSDRRQRRAQLMRDSHEEVSLELVGFVEALGHLAKAPGEVADLVTAGRVRHLDVVVSLGNLVGGFGEALDRLRDPAGQVPGQRARDGDPDEAREREPLDQRLPALAKLGSGLGDDESADVRLSWSEAERRGHGEVLTLRARRRELERSHLPVAPGDDVVRQVAQAGPLAVEDPRPGVEQTAAACLL